MNAQWMIEVESGICWSTVCRCGSQEEAERRARYFRPMACFSGRELRVHAVQHTPQESVNGK